MKAKNHLPPDRSMPSKPPPRVSERLSGMQLSKAVRVTDTGSESFGLVTRYPGDRHPTAQAIGTVGAIGLAKAGVKAIEWIAAVADGIDPQDPCRRNSSQHLKAVAKDYLKRHAHLRSIEQRRDYFERLIYPKL